MQLALLRLSKACQRTNGLHRGKGSHQATHRAKHALRGTVVAIIGVMRIADKATIARCIIQPSGECTNLSMKLANRGANQRHLRGKAQLVDDQARGEIIAAVDHDIDALQNVYRGGAVNTLLEAAECYIRI